jgi:hypothetical protein
MNKRRTDRTTPRYRESGYNAILKARGGAWTRHLAAHGTWTCLQLMLVEDIRVFI